MDTRRDSYELVSSGVGEPEAGRRTLFHEIFMEELDFH
jgi:hypothetical protein